GEEVHDRGLVRDQDQLLAGGGPYRTARAQVPDDAAEDILDIVKTFLKERVGQFLKRRNILVKRLQEGAFGAAAGHQTGGQVLLDGCVLHDHELSLQDGAVIFAHEHGDALAQARDLITSGLHGRGQTLLLAAEIVGSLFYRVPPIAEAVNEIR